MLSSYLCLKLTGSEVDDCMEFVLTWAGIIRVVGGVGGKVGILFLSSFILTLLERISCGIWPTLRFGLYTEVPVSPSEIQIRKNSKYIQMKYKPHLLLASNCVRSALVCWVSKDGSLAADISGGLLIGSRVFDLDLPRPRGAFLRRFSTFSSFG